MPTPRELLAEAASSLVQRLVPDRGAVEERLTEALEIEHANVGLLRESLAELELAVEDEGWRRLSIDGEREFTRDGLAKIIQLSRLMYLKNPLIQRAVEVRSYYVWGQGVSITARDDAVQDVIERFMRDKGNRRVLFRHQAQTALERDVEVEGNLFFALFTNPSSGRVQVRTIPVDEIVDIITNPDDRSEPWFYERRWNAEKRDAVSGTRSSVSMRAFYPAVDYRPDSKPASMFGARVEWDAPVYHVSAGGLSGMRFGVPETYAALDWARAYKSFLEDWASIVRALSRFAWRMTTAKGKAAAAKARIGSTVSRTSRETNPMPPAGGVFIGEENVDLTPIPKTGATTSADDARQLRLMVASAMHLPDTILSNDPMQGALATAKTLDRPTELSISDRQELWADVIRDLLGYVLVQAAKAANGRLQAKVDVDEDGSERIVLDDERDESIDVAFPEILEQDIVERINAIIAAATLNGGTPAGTMDDETMIRLLLVALGVDNVDDLVQAAIDAKVDAGDEAEDGLAEAVRRLAEAVKA